MSILKILVFGENPDLEKILNPFLDGNGDKTKNQKSLQFVFAPSKEEAIQKITEESFDYIVTTGKIRPAYLQELLKLIQEADIALLCLACPGDKNKSEAKMPASILP